MLWHSNTAKAIASATVNRSISYDLTKLRLDDGDARLDEATTGRNYELMTAIQYSTKLGIDNGRY